jgi:hypothetical protein
MSHWQSQGLPVFCWNMTPVYRIIATMIMGLTGCSESGIDGPDDMEMLYIQKYTLIKYHLLMHKKKKKHGQATADQQTSRPRYCYSLVLFRQRAYSSQ